MAQENQNEFTEEQKVALFKVSKIQAENGDVRAYPYLAECYATGLGCEPDMQEAVNWWLKGAKAGEPSCQYNVAIIYLNGAKSEEDIKKAYELIEAACKQNHKEAFFTMGGFYLTGTHVRKNSKKAYEYYLKSANLGYAEAQYMIGSLLLKGQGVTKNVEESLEWFTKAASQGHQKAMEILAKCSSNQEVVKKAEILDDPECAEAVIKMADAGDVEMQFRAGMIYDNGNGVEADFKKALEYYTKAAENGYYFAYYKIAIMYTRARLGLKEDYVNGVKYFTLASDHGIEEATLALALIYITGYKVEEDIVKGTKLLKKLSKTNKTAKELMDLYDSQDDTEAVKKEFTKHLNVIVRGKDEDEVKSNEKISFTTEDELSSLKEGTKKKKTKKETNPDLLTFDINIYNEKRKAYDECMLDDEIMISDSCSKYTVEEKKEELENLFTWGIKEFLGLYGIKYSVGYCLHEIIDNGPQNDKDYDEMLLASYKAMKHFKDLLRGNTISLYWFKENVLKYEDLNLKMMDLYKAKAYEDSDDEYSEKCYKKALDNNLEFAYYFYALKCYKNKKYKKALNNINKLLEINNDYTKLLVYPLLATMYMEGNGVEKDLVKAYNLCVEGAHAGYGKCITLLGDFYMNGILVEKDITKALSLYLLAYKSDDWNAGCKRAQYYYNVKENDLCRNTMSGNESPEFLYEFISNDYDNDRLFAWGTRSEALRTAGAANLYNAYCALDPTSYSEEIDLIYTTEEYALNAIKEGELKANYVLAELEYDTDKEKAMTLYQIAADAGCEKAKYRLSQMYLNGILDTKKGMAMLKESAEAGHRDALCDLGIRYLNGKDIKKNKAKAIECLISAANRNHPDALYQVAQLVESNDIKHIDDSSIYKIYYKAFVFGNKDACNYLASYYEDKNDQLRKCFHVYAKTENSDALYLLGYYLLTGEEITRDVTSAILVLERAAKLGNPRADFLLASYHVDNDNETFSKFTKKNTIKYLKTAIENADKLLGDDPNKQNIVAKFNEALAKL